MTKECKILVDSVCPNPRCICHIEELEELISSLKRQGQLEPVQVTLERKVFLILDGEKRWRACKKIGWRKIWVIIYNL
ncbi:MAG: ParB N-terminal domain-containing protein [Thermodesulfobacteriota bacterium]